MSARPAWLPTSMQQHLLDACLLDAARARRAFGNWRPLIDIDRLDAGSYRLLPLLWKRISLLGFDDPARNVIKGVYRRTWYFNQIVIARAADLVATLASSGISAMILKGAALTLQNYRDEGVRPMGDIDIAVPRSSARRAVDVLVNAGWAPGVTPLTGAMVEGTPATVGWTVGPRPLTSFDDAYFGVRHAHGFKGLGGMEVDLHWFLFQGACDLRVDDTAWAAVRPLTLRGVSAVAPDPADHLLLLLAHGSRWNPIPPVRWVADAVTLLRTEAALRWERVVAGARSRGLTLLAREMLTYLEDRFAVGVPDKIFSQLHAAPITWLERRAYELRVSPPGIATGLEELRYLHERHRAFRRSAAGNGVPGFPAFVRHVLGARSLAQVGLYTASEVVRRIRERPSTT